VGDSAGGQSGPEPGAEGIASDGQGKADGLPLTAAGGNDRGGEGRTSRSSLRRDRARGAARRTISRAELAAKHASFTALSPEVGLLDENELPRLLAADPDATVTLLADLTLATDTKLRATAQRLAARVFVQLGATGWRQSRGTRRLGPGSHDDGDLDLDRTFERWQGSWPPDADQLVTRSWQAHPRAVCLLIDTSGSMSGLAIAIAAVAAAGVVLAARRRLDPGVVAFGGDVTVLQAQGKRRVPEELVGDLLKLRGHGMTDLAAGLRAAGEQLASAAARDRVTILLSDCLRTAGGDPASALTGIDKLQVICPLPTEESQAAAAILARRGGGVSQPVRTLADVAPALARVLS
jgi:magnesium chelatase subunit D